MATARGTPASQPSSFILRAEPAERRAVIVLVGVFAVSRVCYAIAGVHFYTTQFLKTFMQFIDIRLLQDDLWSSVWNFHAQPPLFNLFAGLVVHLPGSEGAWFHSTYIAMGVVLTLSMFVLMRELDVPVGLAFVTTVMFAVLPVTVLYENFLSYTYPVAVLLLASGVFLVRYLRSRRPLYGFLLLATLAVLVLTRSTYHLVWLVAVAAGVLLLARPRSRRVLALLLIPVVVAAFWYGKNWVQFGTTTSSSWVGMNLAKATLHQASRGEVKELVRRGDLSPQALIPPFSPPEAYRPLPRRTGVAVLDERRKAGGEANYNHKVYLRVSDQYFDDSVQFIRTHPADYARALANSYRFFWLPGSDYTLDRAPVDGLDRFLNRFLFLQPRGYFSNEKRGFASPVSAYVPGLAQMAWGAVLVYVAAWLFAVYAAWAIVRRRNVDRPRAATIAFLGLTVLYVTVLSNAAEIGENNRIRFETDPVMWVLFVVLLVRLVGIASARWRPEPRGGRGRANAPVTEASRARATRSRPSPLLPAGD
jgi:hypothetical protein